jgi:hypothetical protein
VPEKAKVPENVGKRIVLDQATWQLLDLLARDRMMTFQELADEAFLDVLRKHGRPYDTRDALKKSAKALNVGPKKSVGPKSKRPTENRRARS